LAKSTDRLIINGKSKAVKATRNFRNLSLNRHCCLKGLRRNSLSGGARAGGRRTTSSALHSLETVPITIGVLAHRRGSLDASRALGAMLIGSAIFGFGGWVWGLTLITFFVSSSMLSRYKDSLSENLVGKFAEGPP